MSQNDNTASKTEISKHEIRARATQGRIYDSAIKCLDKLGYAETSINRIQEEAQVSRGALTYHFPTKQELMAATAMRMLSIVSSILENQSIGEGSDKTSGSFGDMVRYSWHQLVNTPEGRAFFEILVACRTDKELKKALENDIRSWEKEIGEKVKDIYKDKVGDANEAVMIWSITRIFLRGLLVQERFIEDPKKVNEIVERFADMLDGVCS